MTRTEAALRAALAARPLYRLLNDQLRRTVADPLKRERLNRKYVRFSPIEKALFHAMYSKAFRNGDTSTAASATWTVTFSGKQVKLPLRPDSMWLDWDNASGITGHDIEVKSTYESLLASSARPRVFFDIGANYGTHSLLFLAQGVNVVSFEPNPACCVVFEEMCTLNGFAPRIERGAVSDVGGTAEFWFPIRDTWLGTMVDASKEYLKDEFDLEKITVQVTTVDDYVARTGIEPDLMKIDTEGNEAKVLLGAKATLTRKRPLVIFEANALGDRDALWTELSDLNYEIAELPITDARTAASLTMDGFLSNKTSNFIALPRG